MNFKQYTREEFIGFLEDCNYGGKAFCNPSNPLADFTCPEDMHLTEDKKYCKVGNRKCKECWLNTIKDVVFKDEEDKKTKEYREALIKICSAANEGQMKKIAAETLDKFGELPLMLNINFCVLKCICKYLENDNEDEWCEHNDNTKHNLYCSCNEQLCPIIKRR